jgi:hypothetical protein
MSGTSLEPMAHGSARSKLVWLPAFPEIFLAILLLTLFGRASAWQTVLGDADTGWHIRTGEYILRWGTVPVRDLFSFSRPDQPWFAWEWLADVAFAQLHRWGGLEAVAGLCIVLLCASAAIVLAWLLRRGAGLWVALLVTLAVVSASSIHYLARPHVFSILFFPLALGLVDADRQRPAPRVWLLLPLSALWANLHGGFVAWLVTVSLLPLAVAVGHDWRKFRRYVCLAVLCAGSTLLNPYGWRLHEHIVSYLGSSWILDNVNEFQSPRIRSENMLVFAFLLLGGVALASRALARREWFSGGLVLFWALAALRSVRHVPLYAMAAAPVVATELSAWWGSVVAGSRPQSLARVFWDSGQELGRSRRLGLWTPVLAALAVWAAAPFNRISDFPATGFPVAAVAHTEDRLAPPGRMPRILTSDQWGDYLIFHLYPRQRVFFDGRSDFYGPVVGADYQDLMGAAHRWPEIFSRYGFEVALLPYDWPLGSILERDPGWELVYRDKVALVLVRRPDPIRKSSVKKKGASAEWRTDG